MASGWNEYRYPVARKPHRCEWCGEMIAVGERHAQFVGMFEGDFQNWRLHAECQEAAYRDADSDGTIYIETHYCNRGKTHDETDARWDAEQREKRLAAGLPV